MHLIDVMKGSACGLPVSARFDTILPYFNQEAYASCFNPRLPDAKWMAHTIVKTNTTLYK